MFSDNVVPAVLRAKGVLHYSDALAQIVDSDMQLQDREQEASIRAAAVVACDEIVRRYNERPPATTAAVAATSDAAAAAESHAEPSAASASAQSSLPLTALALDYHLWLLGKEPQLRALPRHATRSSFY